MFDLIETRESQVVAAALRYDECYLAQKAAQVKPKSMKSCWEAIEHLKA